MTRRAWYGIYQEHLPEPGVNNMSEVQHLYKEVADRWIKLEDSVQSENSTVLPEAQAVVDAIDQLIDAVIVI